MPPDIVTIPCRTDNYAYLIHEPGSDVATLVDAPEAAPIEAELTRRGWRLATILVTHHHDDHVAGVAELRARDGATVVGAAADRHRLPALDVAVSEGDAIGDGALRAEVLEVPGHTVGHVAYRFADADALFSADSLMIMGCGRLFEGTPAQMWASLGKMAALPRATKVYSGHEYTASNMRFALSIEPENAALRERAAEIDALRASGRPTVPATLELERATNPFLRAVDPALRVRLGMPDASDVEVFAELRHRKDSF